MKDSQESSPIDGFCRYLIWSKARAYQKRLRFPEEDLEDLRHDVVVAVLERWPKYRESRGKRSTFIKRLVENAFADWLGRHDRERKRRSTASLSSGVRGEGGRALTLADTTSRDARQCEPSLDGLDLDELQAAIQRLIDAAPARTQELVKRMRLQQPIAMAAREMGVPRTTLNDDIRRLRRQFEDVGLRDFL